MPQLRKDPVTGRWIIIATERSLRPHDFSTEMEGHSFIPAKCPFCQGNEHLTPNEIVAIRKENTEKDKPGWQVRVIPNKFPALRIEGDLEKRGIGMYDMMNGIGAHEVIVETPDHHKSLKEMSSQEIGEIITVMQNRIEDLHRDKRLRYILVFKNHATPVTPKRVKEELNGARRYFDLKERCIFCDVISQERDSGVRIVYENEEFLAYCPFASRFPFEICIIPKQHHHHFFEMEASPTSLGEIIKVTLIKLSKALKNPQYNLLIHTAPNLTSRRGYWTTINEDFHWHIELMPRLLRTAGFEWGTGFYINPTVPEEAARYLRNIEVNI